MKTKGDIQKRKSYVSSRFKRCSGHFSDRAPLNAKTTGRIDHDNYYIEKIIYQSSPNFPVTVNLYVPKNVKIPVLGILSPCGYIYI